MKLLTPFIDWFTRFLHSFDTDKGGLSARKLSAFWGMMLAAYLSINHTDKTNLDAVLITWLVFVSVCLGLVTAEQITKFKSEKNDAK